MNTKERKIIDVAVILDNEQILRDVIATDENFSVILEPRNARDLFRIMGKWAKEGKKIRRLILAGHGHWTQHHIGMIVPDDFDLKKIQDKRMALYKQRLVEEKNRAKDEQVLLVEKDEKARQRLLKRIDAAKKRLEMFTKSDDGYKEKERELVDMADVMDKNAVVGLINCCAAYDEGGREFMDNISEILLSRNGGRITGCTGIVDVVTVDTIWQGMVYWMHNREWRYADEPALKGEKWVSINKDATGKSYRNCGVPCKDFERYGFCDNPVKGEGPCFMHR